MKFTFKVRTECNRTSVSSSERQEMAWHLTPVPQVVEVFTSLGVCHWCETLVTKGENKNISPKYLIARSMRAKFPRGVVAAPENFFLPKKKKEASH